MTTYIIKSILCSGVLLMFYHLFLQKEKMHHFNRFYLLTSIILSLGIPLISIELKQESMPISILNYEQTSGLLFEIPNNNIHTEPLTVRPDTRINWMEYVPMGFYILIVVFLLARLTRNLRAIYSKTYANEIILHQGTYLVLLPEQTVTFTFLNYIFISKGEYNQKLIEEEVLIHEMAHVRQKHSLDILFMEILLAVFWFNPLLLIYKKAIRLNHEFLADEAVLSKHFDVSRYQLMLLDKILFTKQVNLTSSFNYSITKQRLTMMTKSSNRMLQMLKKCAVSLLTIGLVFAFCEKIYSQKKKTSPIQKSQPTAKSEKSSISDNPNTAIRRRYKSPGAGLTQEEMKEFNSTVEKHKVSGKDIKGRPYVDLKLSVTQKNRMYDLFCKMNAEQHENNQWEFFQMPIPVKSSPTPEIFELWKNPNVMGVWLNGKKINNTELNRYQNTDIAEYSLSKLYGAAKKGRIYKYQLDLTTNEEFDKTFDARVADRILVMSHQYFQPKP